MILTLIPLANRTFLSICFLTLCGRSELKKSDCIISILKLKNKISKINKYKILNKYTFSFKVKNKNNNHYFILDDFDMLMKKDEIDKLKIEADLDNEYVLVYLSNKLIHTEKLYKNTYNLTKRSKLKELLSFFKF